MLEYRLISDENGIRKYAYYVEGIMDSEPGIVAFGDGRKKFRIKKAPSDDFGLYIGHAFSGIDVSRDSGCVAWC